MPYFFYGYDPYYWMILVPAMLIALFAQLKVSSTFNRYDRVRSARGYTGAQAAEAVLRQHGVTDVRIERVRGRLTDHYDPRSNVIRLSDAVYASNSVAAMGVAAHEAGHAVQYAVGPSGFETPSYPYAISALSSPSSSSSSACFYAPSPCLAWGSSSLAWRCWARW